MGDTPPKFGLTGANIAIIIMLATSIFGGGVAYSNILNTDMQQNQRMDQIDRDRSGQRANILDKIDQQHRDLVQLRQDMQTQFERDERQVAQAQTTVTSTASNLNDRLTRIEAKLEFLVSVSTPQGQRR